MEGLRTLCKKQLQCLPSPSRAPIYPLPSLRGEGKSSAGPASKRLWSGQSRPTAEAGGSTHVDFIQTERPSVYVSQNFQKKTTEEI